MTGWLKIHRQLLHSPVFENEKIFKVFMYCLMKASHKQHKQVVGRKTVELNSGEFIFGRSKASAELNMTPSTVWSYMKLLEEMDNIKINSNNKFSVINVVNWGFYQGSEDFSDNKQTTDEQQTDNKQTADGQQTDTNKNVKNVENVNNEKNEENNAPSEWETDFEEWWNIYNKKIDKKKVKTIFKRCHKNDGYEKIKHGTLIYLKTVTDKQFQKNPQTFLNAESYNDVEGYEELAKQKAAAGYQQPKVQGTPNSQEQKDAYSHFDF